uniref:AsmA domain-containing protein n=1 Tax=uncultured organism TaxID=155900 RepID=M1PWY7_9ZZZZ|nr:conserved hypothetical protein, secreted [uncultured organism]
MKKRYFLEILGYIAFALLVFIFVCTANFPYAALEERIETTVAQRSDQRIDINGLDYNFPLGVYIQRLNIKPDSKYLDEPTEISNCNINMDLFHLITGSAKTNFSLQLLNGSMQGILDLDSLFQPSKYDLNLDWKQLALKDNPLNYNRNRVKSLQGFCSGEIKLRGDLNKPLQSTGEGNMKIREVGLQLAVPPLPQQDFKDFQGNCDWQLKNRKFYIGNCNLQGKGIQGNTDGNLRLRTPLARSNMDLTGEIRFTESDPKIYSLAQKYMGTNKLNFQLKGSLNNPAYSLN